MKSIKISTKIEKETKHSERRVISGIMIIISIVLLLNILSINADALSPAEDSYWTSELYVSGPTEEEIKAYALVNNALPPLFIENKAWAYVTDWTEISTEAKIDTLRKLGAEFNPQGINTYDYSDGKFLFDASANKVYTQHFGIIVSADDLKGKMLGPEFNLPENINILTPEANDDDPIKVKIGEDGTLTIDNSNMKEEYDEETQAKTITKILIYEDYRRYGNSPIIQIIPNNSSETKIKITKPESGLNINSINIDGQEIIAKEKSGQEIYARMKKDKGLIITIKKQEENKIILTGFASEDNIDLSNFDISEKMKSEEITIGWDQSNILLLEDKCFAIIAYDYEAMQGKYVADFQRDERGDLFENGYSEDLFGTVNMYSNIKVESNPQELTIQNADNILNIKNTDSFGNWNWDDSDTNCAIISDNSYLAVKDPQAKIMKATKAYSKPEIYIGFPFNMQLNNPVDINSISLGKGTTIKSIYSLKENSSSETTIEGRDASIVKDILGEKEIVTIEQSEWFRMTVKNDSYKTDILASFCNGQAYVGNAIKIDSYAKGIIGENSYNCDNPTIFSAAYTPEGGLKNANLVVYNPSSHNSKITITNPKSLDRIESVDNDKIFFFNGEPGAEKLVMIDNGEKETTIYKGSSELQITDGTPVIIILEDELLRKSSKRINLEEASKLLQENGLSTDQLKIGPYEFDAKIKKLSELQATNSDNRIKQKIQEYIDTHKSYTDDLQAIVMIHEDLAPEIIFGTAIINYRLNGGEKRTAEAIDGREIGKKINTISDKKNTSTEQVSEDINEKPPVEVTAENKEEAIKEVNEEKSKAEASATANAPEDEKIKEQEEEYETIQVTETEEKKIVQQTETPEVKKAAEETATTPEIVESEQKMEELLEEQKELDIVREQVEPIKTEEQTPYKDTGSTDSDPSKILSESNEKNKTTLTNTETGESTTAVKITSIQQDINSQYFGILRKAASYKGESYETVKAKWKASPGEMNPFELPAGYRYPGYYSDLMTLQNIAEKRNIPQSEPTEKTLQQQINELYFKILQKAALYKGEKYSELKEKWQANPNSINPFSLPQEYRYPDYESDRNTLNRLVSAKNAQG